MSFRVYIPARHASTRLPGKPLLDIAGKPLIRHVWERAVESGAESVVIATDDERIRDCATAFGATVCMTSSEHRSGTDRLAEAVASMGEPPERIVVNLQGDEPSMPGRLIARVAALLAAEEHCHMATLSVPITDLHELLDPNVAKVVVGARGEALYFSRAPIPFRRDAAGLPVQGGPFLRHVGLYAYRAGFLRHFSQLPRCAIEQLECLEQLRALYHGHRIQVAIADGPVEKGVDTEIDLAAARAYFADRRRPFAYS